MTYMLEHKYCSSSLSFQLLKNVDRAVANLLIQARDKVDFDLYLGIVQYNKHHYPSSDFYSGFDTENFHGFASAKHLKPPSGKQIVSHIKLFSPNSFVPSNFFEKLKPDNEEIKEYTGNQGTVLAKQYKNAALLLWPIRKRVAVVGIVKMIKIFEKAVKDLNCEEKSDLYTTARDIMKRMDGYVLDESLNPFLHALETIDGTKLIAEFPEKIVALQRRFVEKAYIFNNIGRKNGWSILYSSLKVLFHEGCKSYNVEKYCHFLTEIASNQLDDELKELCQCLVSIIAQVLTSEQDAECDPANIWWQEQISRSKTFVCELFQLLIKLQCNDLIQSIAEAMCCKPVLYPVLKTLGPAIIDISKSVDIEKEKPLQILLQYCIKQLNVSVKKVTEQVINPPLKFPCKCKDCSCLRHFFKVVDMQQYEFKGDVQHIQQQLDGIKDDIDADITYETYAHTLVIRRSVNTFTHSKEMKLLTSLNSISVSTDQNKPSLSEK